MKPAQYYAQEYLTVLEQRRQEGWGQTRHEKIHLLTKIIRKAMIGEQQFFREVLQDTKFNDPLNQKQ